ncbi:MAG: flagellar filament capping protein FliD [Burkholderiales bacterium]
MKVEQLPLTALQTRATSIQSTISAFGAIQAAMATFRDAASTLSLPSTWNASAGTSADPTSVGVTATASAASGNYAVQVQSLASSQSTVSGTFASSAALVGAGSLHIDLGTWATGQTGFTAKTGSTGMDIAVTATDTLATLASKVNAAGAGVTASVVNDTSGSRLVFSSSTTGTDNGFRITATDGGSGLAAFGFDPPSGATATSLTQSAANASATINGLSVSSATNTLTNVLDGLSLTLAKVTTSPVQIAVAQDTTAVKKSVQAFVDSYNALSTLLSTDLKYDSGTQTAGPLQADSAAASLQRQLRTMIGGPSTSSTAFTTLSQAGVEIQKDGTLKVNDSKLSTALTNTPELKKFFTNVDTANTANNGFGIKLRTLGNSVLGGDGLLTARVAGLNSNLTRNQKDQTTVSGHIADTQARLQKQYSALDTKMAGISTLSTYITQQIANWNKSTG